MTEKEINFHRVLPVFLLVLIFIILFAQPAYATTGAAKYVRKNGVITYTATGERASACDRMYDMSYAPWTTSKSITYAYKDDTEYTLKAGKRRGIPYNQYYRTFPSIEDLQNNIDLAQNPTKVTVTDAESGTETETLITNPVKGLDCSAAATYALRYATGRDGTYSSYLLGNGAVYKSSQFLFDGMNSYSGYRTTLKGVSVYFNNNLSKVGYYGRYSGYTSALETESITEGLLADGNYTTGTVYDNVYAKMKPGDILVRVKRTGLGHIMMVDTVRIVYDEDGNVDPVNSKVYVIDEISPDRSIYKDGCLSSWRNNDTLNPETGKQNNVYTFKSLANGSDYIPVTAWPDTSSYTVSYDLNGGSGYVSSQMKSAYNPLTITSQTPTKTGYTFSHWVSTVNPAELTYTPGDTYFEESDDTLKAVWAPNTGNIIYDANGGENAPADQVQSYGEALTITSKTPERDGYAFIGWATTPDAEEAEYQPGDSYTDDSRLEKGSGASVTLYAVWQMTVADAEVTLSDDSEYYTGEAFIPDYSVSYYGTELEEGVDYEVSLPSNPTKAGTYTIKIMGLGEYTGTNKAEYEILKYSQSISTKATSYKKTYGQDSFTVKASAKTGLKYKSSNKSVATVNSKGKVTIKDVGTATITDTAKTNSTYKQATKDITIKVYPRSTSISSLSSKIKKITVNWKRHTTEASGYQIRYSRNRNMKNAKKITLASSYMDTFTLTKLTPNKRYFVQVRTYRDTGGKTYYSEWSKKKAIKTKKKKSS